jgi:hypothetical protein
MKTEALGATWITTGRNPCSRRAVIRANLRRTCGARTATERTRIETSGLRTETESPRIAIGIPQSEAEEIRTLPRALATATGSQPRPRVRRVPAPSFRLNNAARSQRSSGTKGFSQSPM